MNLPDFLIDHPDGDLRLTGHRIGLFDVVTYFKEGYSPEMLHEEFPTLSLPLIHKVIAFYLENRAEVDAYVARKQAAIDHLRANAPESPALRRLREALQARKRAGTA